MAFAAIAHLYKKRDLWRSVQLADNRCYNWRWSSSWLDFDFDPRRNNNNRSQQKATLFMVSCKCILIKHKNLNYITQITSLCSVVKIKQFSGFVFKLLFRYLSKLQCSCKIWAVTVVLFILTWNLPVSALAWARVQGQSMISLRKLGSWFSSWSHAKHFSRAQAAESCLNASSRCQARAWSSAHVAWTSLNKPQARYSNKRFLKNSY